MSTPNKIRGLEPDNTKKLFITSISMTNLKKIKVVNRSEIGCMDTNNNYVAVND